MEISGRVFVVTGGGNGIGREVVLGLLRRGGRVAAVDLSGERLTQTAGLAGADATRLTTHIVNVTDTEAVQALPQQVIAAHGQVDGVLNVAGIIQRFVHFTELRNDEIERVLTVNFWGVVNMARAFLPHLLARPQAALVNVSSMGAFIPVPGQTIYGASKAAVKLLTEGLHAELRGTPVRVTVVFPGAVATSITENSGVQAPAVAGGNDNAANRKVLPPSQAAQIIIDGMQKGAYRVVVGRDAKVMDWLTRLVPERAMTMIADQMADLLQHRAPV
ncbi:MAG TPA: SDR family oxidoreductase [Propionicimonas sp.]|uniref:SDR family NAD(P)-dependent oxidoreductase n=1 Tax=Propionicimonas sp. TaxID=1955623 RepID=UPI002F42FED9